MTAAEMDERKGVLDAFTLARLVEEARAERDRYREALCAIRDGGSVADHRIAVRALGADHDA
ncbi:MAG: hypothetical protein JWM31_1352 [Solirubrobacterales bacterium]|nr:hypothetical protein [Solirubrobacterales bacterium]